MSRRADGPQLDLFRFDRKLDEPVNLLAIKSAMGVALKECPDSAEIVAAKIATLTGKHLSAHALYTFTKPSDIDHHISLPRFIAFVRVTGAYWLWDILLRPDGLTVMQGRSARLAELAMAERDRKALDARIRDIKREIDVEPLSPPKRGRR